MNKIKTMLLRLQDKRVLTQNVIASGVLLTGILTIASVLFTRIPLKMVRVIDADAHVTLIVGLSFVYLASLLRRGKYNAWLISVPLYAFLVARNVRVFLVEDLISIHHPVLVFLNLLVPALSLYGLLMYKNDFVVKSEVRSFTVALRTASLVLLVALFYGVIGFSILDTKDFHQEISIGSAVHHTVDQFNLTTGSELKPYTRRARLLLNSLATISAGSLFYVVLSLFAPIKFKLTNQSHSREVMQTLLERFPASSEAFFYLWPHDKAYFFNDSESAGLAYRVVNGVALVLGDPAGRAQDFYNLLDKFMEYCRINDWEVALIHTAPEYSDLYKRLDFNLQKIGEYAVVDTGHFVNSVIGNKYFRNIRNRFDKAGYSFEVLNPPHNADVIKRLTQISDSWLEGPGRTERGLLMGYFSAEYMQQNQLLVVRDAAHTIQAFANRITSFDNAQANFDLLRSSKDVGLSNINDFLMLNFLEHLRGEGIKRLNMGLSPLAGADELKGEEANSIDNIMRLAYLGGGRFYSFAGLQKFKAKYEPEWYDRYIAYRGGLPTFGRILRALMRGLKVSSSRK